MLIKTQKLGLIHLFRHNLQFKRLVHRYMALPLLPAARITHAVDELNVMALDIQPDEQRRFDLFRRYIRTFWLTKVTPERLSVFGLPRRSNNSVESFHSSLKKKVKKPHPNIYVFIEHLNNVIAGKLSDMKALRNGHAIAKRRPLEQLTNEETLRTLEQQLTNGTISTVRFLSTCCARFHRYVDINLDSDNDSSNDDVNDAPFDEPVTTDDDATGEESDDTPPPDNDDDNADGVDDNEPSTQDNICPVCMVSGKNSVINPCGHTGCYECMDVIVNMQPPRNKCPECRIEVINVIRVFGMS